MTNATIFALAAGIADLPNEDARLAAARIVAHVAQTERESFDVENFATACGIARHLAPGLLALRLVEGKLSEAHKCDPRCTSATGHKCDCSCAGANHGADWL